MKLPKTFPCVCPYKDFPQAVSAAQQDYEISVFDIPEIRFYATASFEVFLEPEFVDLDGFRKDVLCLCVRSAQDLVPPGKSC